MRLTAKLPRRVKTKTYLRAGSRWRGRAVWPSMNLYLHGIEPHIRLGDSIYEPPSGERFDVVLTNPPFGTKGANQAPEREDFTISTTSNKQLNFVQHVLTILKPGGRAAVVLPRQPSCSLIRQARCARSSPRSAICTRCCGFRAERSRRIAAGRQSERRFLHQGLRRPRTAWIYDARTNVPGHHEEGPAAHAPSISPEFVKCYGADPNGRAKRKPADSKEDRLAQLPHLRSEGDGSSSSMGSSG